MMGGALKTKAMVAGYVGQKNKRIALIARVMFVLPDLVTFFDETD